MKNLALIALAALATAHAAPTRTATEGYVDRTVASATNGLATKSELAWHVPARAETVGTDMLWTDATGVVWRVVREYGPWTHRADGEASVTWFWGEDPNGETGWVGGAAVGGVAGMPTVRSKDPDAVSVAWSENNVSILSTRGVSATTAAVDRVSYASGLAATFSNAVLSVGLNIDTNSVAVLNEIAATFGGFPIEGTATTVGGLLAALAAAIAWLKKNKVGSFASVGGASATVENGVAKLDDFFTNSNSLLTATIDARLPYPLYAVPSTGVLKDRAINTTSLDSVTVPDNFTDLIVRASVASSLSVTMPDAIATKYGDTFPSEAGEYLITITKTGAAEAYVRTIKLEVANA